MPGTGRRWLPALAGASVGSVLVLLLPLWTITAGLAGVIAGFLSPAGERSTPHGALAGTLVHLVWQVTSETAIDSLLAGTDIVGNVLILAVGLTFGAVFGGAGAFFQQVVVDTTDSLEEQVFEPEESTDEEEES